MADIWWFLIGLAAGLLVVGGAVYLLTSRRKQASLRKRLTSKEIEREAVGGPLVGRRMAGEEPVTGADRPLKSLPKGFQMDSESLRRERMVEADYDEAPPPRRGRSETRAAMEEEESGPQGDAAPVLVPADLVHFSVAAPPSVQAGSTFLLGVWAHLDSQRGEVLARARQELSQEPVVSTRGPARVKRGTRLAFHLEVEGMTVEEPVGWVDWEGEPAQAAFFVDAPADAAAGNHKGRLSVCVEGVPIMEMRFLIRVGEAAAESAPLTTEVQRYRSAFASYSRKDRAEVFKRIQGIHQVVPDLDIFVDVDSLHSGQDWEKELWRQISGRDVFFLFWSSNALKSKWVEKEWRFALEKRGLDFIDPVPLEPPDQAPPPPELAGKHFNDRELVFIKAFSDKP